jgi:hypothetical protein
MPRDKKSAKRPTRIKNLKSKKSTASKAESVKGGQKADATTTNVVSKWSTAQGAVA